MAKNTLRNTARQHLEGDAFFTGFTIKSKNQTVPAGAIVNAPHPPAPVDGDFSALIGTIRTCQKCGLARTRTHAVPGEGHPHARLMFVGEAPGADEDAQGRPFVGRAGQLLDKIIGACGLARPDVYIANTLKCRPPGNRDPHPDEIDCCLPYLRQQLALIQPKIIVALGAHAARTVLGSDETIGRLRGQFHDCVVAPPDSPIQVMPTYHPAYLLRNYSTDNRRRVWEDMKKVIAELGLPVPG